MPPLSNERFRYSTLRYRSGRTIYRSLAVFSRCERLLLAVGVILIFLYTGPSIPPSGATDSPSQSGSREKTCAMSKSFSPFRRSPEGFGGTRLHIFLHKGNDVRIRPALPIPNRSTKLARRTFK
jgi:hypothetical protein